jgi:hypothetical protein
MLPPEVPKAFYDEFKKRHENPVLNCYCHRTTILLQKSGKTQNSKLEIQISRNLFEFWISEFVL